MMLYGDAGDKWPVKAGEVWGVGDHLFTCIDLTMPSDFRRLESMVRGVKKPRISYVDPPWNPGNATAFRTKAGLARKSDFPELLDNVLRAVKLAMELAFIEFGRSHLASLKAACDRAGVDVLRVWDTTYYSKRPSHLVAVSLKSSMSHQLGDYTSMDDLYTPGKVIEEHTLPGDYVLDPCVGRGLTAVRAHELGRVCVGGELHPRRLAVTLDKLCELGAGVPRRVS